MNERRDILDDASAADVLSAPASAAASGTAPALVAGPVTAAAATSAATESCAAPDAVAAPESVTEPAAEPAAAAPEPRPATPGTRLRERREERGIGLQQITDSLHIEPRLVAAMEADEFAAFDAPVYARGFLRKYATFLDLSPDEIVAGYDALHRGPDAPSLIPTASATEPPRDWSRLKLPAVAAVVVAVVAGSYWWWLMRAPDLANAQRGAASVATQAAAPTTAPAAGATPALEGTAADAIVPSADDAADSAAPLTGAAQVAVAMPAGVGAVAPAPPPRVAGRGALEFRFSADCWIEVYGPAGERLLFDLAHAGESRAVSGPGPWRVFVGYADGVRLTFGGRSVPIPADRRRGSTARFAVAADGSAQ